MPDPKHTPGPWFRGDLVWHDPGENQCGQRFAVVRSGHGDPVALVLHDEDDAEQDDRTAALVAAAPDLLGALKELLAEWETDHQDTPTARWPETGGVMMARSAIAKAQGKVVE